MAQTPAIRLADVSLVYQGAGREVRALDGVSLEIPVGQRVCVLGANGSGKSTLASVIAGLMAPDAGTVELVGERVCTEGQADFEAYRRARRLLGLVFQNPDSQLFCPSVYEEVAFGPRQMGLGEDEVARRVTDTLALFGLAGFEERSPWRLSGGEKRRVALAAIVSMGPELLMLDELVDGLDVEPLGRVADFIESYVAAGGTVLVTTHHHDHVRLPEARHVVMDAHHRIA